MIMTHKIKGKFHPKWERPFVVESVYSNGAYCLITPDGDTIMMPMQILKEVLSLGSFL